MPKPTPTQRRVLEAMRDEWRLLGPTLNTPAALVPPEGGKSVTVSVATLDAMSAAGWVRPAPTARPSLHERYVLTDAGAEALRS